jgi:hypothetical protein
MIEADCGEAGMTGLPMFRHEFHDPLERDRHIRATQDRAPSAVLPRFAVRQGGPWGWCGQAMWRRNLWLTT